MCPGSQSRFHQKTCSGGLLKQSNERVAEDGSRTRHPTHGRPPPHCKKMVCNEHFQWFHHKHTTTGTLHHARTSLQPADSAQSGNNHNPRVAHKDLHLKHFRHYTGIPPGTAMCTEMEMRGWGRKQDRMCRILHNGNLLDRRDLELQKHNDNSRKS